MTTCSEPVATVSGVVLTVSIMFNICWVSAVLLIDDSAFSLAVAVLVVWLLLLGVVVEIKLEVVGAVALLVGVGFVKLLSGELLRIFVLFGGFSRLIGGLIIGLLFGISDIFPKFILELIPSF